MTKLSDTQRVILSAAAQHEMGLARAPKTLPAAARNAVFRNLIKNNLLTEINAPREHVGLGWRQDEDGTWIVARITDDGLRAIGIDPNTDDAREEDEQNAEAIARPQRRAPRRRGAAPVADTAPTGGEDATERDGPAEDAEPAQGATTPAPRASLRYAAAAVWPPGTPARRRTRPTTRSAAPSRPSAPPWPASRPRRARAGAPRKPREGTKQETVLAMLRREEGATIAHICEATGWQQHAVRGFFAGLKKRQGIEVQVLERVRQVGPNKEGAKRVLHGLPPATWARRTDHACCIPRAAAMSSKTRSSPASTAARPVKACHVFFRTFTNGLFCLVTNGAGVDQNQIGFFQSLGGIVSVRGEDGSHDFAVRKIHRTAVAFYKEFFGILGFVF